MMISNWAVAELASFCINTWRQTHFAGKTCGSSVLPVEILFWMSVNSFTRQAVQCDAAFFWLSSNWWAHTPLAAVSMDWYGDGSTPFSFSIFWGDEHPSEIRWTILIYFGVHWPPGYPWPMHLRCSTAPLLKLCVASTLQLLHPVDHGMLLELWTSAWKTTETVTEGTAAYFSRRNC